jgi:hypothetical protein
MTSKIEEVRHVYELAAMGLSAYAIAKITPHRNETVTKWLKDPGKWSPYLDEIAMSRALSGDRKVFQNLSLMEAQEFWQRAARKSHESHLWAVKDKDTASQNPWAEEMADLLGWDNKIFRATCAKAKAKMMEDGTW